MLLVQESGFRRADVSFLLERSKRMKAKQRWNRWEIVYRVPGYDRTFSEHFDTEEAANLRIAEIAGNPYLIKYLRQLQMHITRFEHIFIRDEGDRKHSTQDHQAIIEAIAAGDKVRAAALAEAKGRLEETEEKLKLVELTSTIVDREDKTELKKQINDWVREIDNSIKLLNGK